MANQECLFCKIVAGDIPAHKIYEDEQYLAFLDIFPVTEGHTVVIPKKHARWVWDVENSGEYFTVITKIGKHLQQATGKELIASMTIGEMIPHAHYHLLPDSTNVQSLVKAAEELAKQSPLSNEDGANLASKLKLN